jgi:hypothetical protein
MAAKRTRLIHKVAIQLQPSGRELYHLQVSLQAASPETFGYTFVLSGGINDFRCVERRAGNHSINPEDETQRP